MTTVRHLKIVIDHAGDAEKGIGKLAGALGPIGKAAGLAVGGVTLLSGAAIGLGAKLVSLGSDAEEMTSKFNTVFGDTAPRVTQALDNFGNTVGRNKYELMEMAASLQDTFVPLGFARDAASGLSIQMTQLAVDVASFNNAAESDVMRDFQSALVGNHETVRKYGIVISQATLDQELMRMGIKGGVDAASEQEKVMARLNLIMQGTTDAQGDAARTSGSWANQMRALKSSISEAATEAGVKLLPVVSPMLQKFTALAQEVLPLMVDRFIQFANEVGPVISDAGVLINDALTRIGKALGITSDDVSGIDVVMGLFGATLDAIVIGIQLFAVTLEGIASVVEIISEKVKAAIKTFNELKAIIDKVGVGTALAEIGKGIVGSKGTGPAYPGVPHYQGGGIVPGPMGRPQLAVVHGGEHIIDPRSGGGGHVTVDVPIVLQIDGDVVARVLGQRLARLQRMGGTARL